MPTKPTIPTLILLLSALLLTACGGTQKSSTDSTATTVVETAVDVQFQADSAFAFCQQQCDFGPRTMNSEAHERCAQWIAAKFQSYGMDVTEQRATLTGFDGTPLLSNNIIASFHPERENRIMLCAHWDSRPWADNDPDEANHRKPVMAANDGASGVAVMLEIARLIHNETNSNTQDTVSAVASTSSAGLPPEERKNPQTSTLNSQLSTLNSTLGVDFICFDAEDWGDDGHSDSWALGAQYWAAHPHKAGYRARYGILLDMVGGQQAHFYREGFSQDKAPQVVSRVWQAAEVAGFSSYFPKQDGGYVTDDHGPVNDTAGIPCIDIIPFYPDCRESSFGPTWHTVSDDMAHIDRATLKAVGQTLVQLLFTEQ